MNECFFSWKISTHKLIKLTKQSIIDEQVIYNFELLCSNGSLPWLEHKEETQNKTKT